MNITDTCGLFSGHWLTTIHDDNDNVVTTTNRAVDDPLLQRDDLSLAVAAVATLDDQLIELSHRLDRQAQVGAVGVVTWRVLLEPGQQ